MLDFENIYNFSIDVHFLKFKSHQYIVQNVYYKHKLINNLHVIVVLSF